MTDNPASIPWMRVLRRALPGMALFLAIGFSLSVLAWVALTKIPGLESTILIEWPAPLLVGFVVLQMSRLKDVILTIQFASRFKFLAGCAQILDEWSRLYVAKIIDREERKLDLELMQPDHDACQAAVHRLFEFHLIQIARAESRRLKARGKDRRAALKIFNARATEVKFKFFLHYLGYEKAAIDIRLIAAEPLKLYKSWPPAPLDRRSGTAVQSPSDRRRKYEHEYVEDYVLGP